MSGLIDELKEIVRQRRGGDFEGLDIPAILAALELGQRLEKALEGLKHHRQHLSRNFPEPGICVRCRNAWPCDVGVALAALEGSDG